MHDSDSDSGIGIASEISQFFAGIGNGIKKTKNYWNRNQGFRVGIGMESVSFLLESESEPESDFCFFLESESEPESRYTRNRASLIRAYALLQTWGVLRYSYSNNPM